MKGIGEILAMVREEFVSPRYQWRSDFPYYGLCVVNNNLYCNFAEDIYSSKRKTLALNYKEHKLFKSYLKENMAKGLTTFWSWTNDRDIIEVDSKWRGDTFLWHPYDRESRLDWLDEHIIINS